MQLDIDFLYNIVIRLPRKVAFLERFHSDKRCVQIQIVFKMKFQVSITCLTFLMYRIPSEILKKWHTSANLRPDFNIYLWLSVLINDWTISLWWQYSRFKCCWVNSLWTIHSIDEKTKFISNKPHLCALIKAPTMVSRVFVVVLNTRYADSNYIDILYQAFFFLLWKKMIIA